MWRASRDSGHLRTRTPTKAKPQQKMGSTRAYGCQYKGERLLYWAYFVPSGGGKK